MAAADESVQTAIDGCAAELLDVLPAAMDAIRGVMRGHVGGQLSIPQFRCLAFIARQPGASLGEVARFLGVTLPTASAMVDRLTRAGALASLPCADDRRRSALSITPAGRLQLKAIRQDAQRDIAQALLVRSAEELNALREGLTVLRRTFSRP